jgi:hypothetical protein
MGLPVCAGTAPLAHFGPCASSLEPLERRDELSHCAAAADGTCRLLKNGIRFVSIEGD